MTGRRGRVVQMSDGSVQYQLRSEPDVSIELLNITEKQRFMNGDKEVAIISEAASSGISLQADKRAKVYTCTMYVMFIRGTFTCIHLLLYCTCTCIVFYIIKHVYFY